MLTPAPHRHPAGATAFPLSGFIPTFLRTFSTPGDLIAQVPTLLCPVLHCTSAATAVTIRRRPRLSPFFALARGFMSPSVQAGAVESPGGDFQEEVQCNGRCTRASWRRVVRS